MKARKFAYLFLVVCLGIAAYFGYDTYRVVQDEKSETSTDEDAGNSKSESNVELKYNEYSIKETMGYSLSEDKGETIKIYFYNAEVNCQTVQVFRPVTSSLIAVVTVPKSIIEKGKGAVTSVSIFKRSEDGSYLEISGVPDTTNLSKIETKADGTGYEGSFDLVWENRSFEGKFESVLCTAN